MEVARVHGLNLALPRLIPGLRPAQAAEHSPDVCVVVEPIDEPLAGIPAGGQELSDGRRLVFIRTRDGAYYVTLDGTTLVAVSQDGRLVRVENMDSSTVRILVDQVLPLLAELHGRTAIHATTVALDRRRIALAGMSGSGKSTLAYRLGKLGATVLAEDVTAMYCSGKEIVVTPGITSVKRRPAKVPPQRTPDVKLPVNLEIEPAGGRLDAFVSLQSQAEMSCTPAAMMPLTHLFVPFVNDQMSLVRHLDLAAQLLRSVRIVKLTTQTVSVEESVNALVNELADLRTA